MKTQITIGLISLLSSFSFAENNSLKTEVIKLKISEHKFNLVAELNKQTVRCLVGDYGASSLKISLPELKGLTVFRHTTAGETEPCINAGICSRFQNGVPNLAPELIIDSSKPTEEIEVLVKLEEVLHINHYNQTCQRSLSEIVTSEVRRYDFKHYDGASLGPMDYEVCLKMKENNK